jgi:serine/threonine protein kinase
MAKKLKVGDTIRGYRIEKVFGPGMMAISYAARSPAGRKVFFKQYKSPAPTVVWYRPFVEYQQELSRRVREADSGHFAVRQLDAFEEAWGGRCYFQAFEFVENGADLQPILDAERAEHHRTGRSPARDPDMWARHVTWAKVLVAGIGALHAAKVVHADLKPANAYLIQDPTIATGYQLKLIDMDFSLLADRRAPWHGFQGYVGSDNYRSPEHLAKGGVPGPASDVFTAGLILYELLAGVHPYWREDQADYAELVRAYRSEPMPLLGVLPAPASNADVSRILHRCLDPDPAARPTATALRAALSGRGRTPASAPAPAARPSAPPDRETIATERIELAAEDGRSLQLGVRTEIGKILLRPFGEDSTFWDDRQCVLDRDARQRWYVAPVAGSTNETLLNGKAVTAPRLLRSGDRLAVGREARGIAKLPLTVRGV